MADNILHLADLGLQAALDAKSSGVLIDAVAFKLGDSDAAHSDADEDIHGNTLIQGNIGYVEVLSKQTARFTLRITPADIGSGVVAPEIGIFLGNGLMLGRCVFDVPLELKQGETHELIVLLNTSKCDLSVINVVLGSYSSIPSTPTVVTLGHPEDSDFTAVVVLDLQENTDNTSSAGIAMKFGSGSLQWAFSGYDRVFSGNPAAGATDSQFTSPALIGSLTFNSGEIVIVYIVAGSGRGQTRKFYFDSSDQTFKLHSASPFQGLMDTSTIVVWRRLGGVGGGVNNYPPQMQNIPHDWVLTRGGGNLPVWAPPKNTGKNLNTLFVAPGRLRITPLNDMGNGQQARYSLGNILVKNVNYCVASLGGITQHKTAYDISSSELEFAENIPTGVPIDFRLITKEPGTGTYIDIVTDEFVGDGTRTSFQLSQPLESAQYAFVYINQLLQSTTVYSYNTATQSLEFVAPIPEGLPLEVSILVPQSSEGYSTELLSTSTVVVGPTLFLELPVKPQSKNHTFVSINGSHVHRNLYSLVDNKIVFSSAVPKGLAVEVLIFNNVLSNGTPQTDLSGVVVDAVLTHKAITLFRHNAPPVNLLLPGVNFKPGKGMRIDGEYPNYTIASTYAEQYTPSTNFRINTRKREEDTAELIFTQKLSITDDVRIMITAGFSAVLGPGFVSIDGSEVIDYVIGFRTTGAKEPDYGRELKGTGTAGFSSLKGETSSNEIAYANASATQIFDIIKDNNKAGYIDLIARVRIRNANIGKYKSALTLDVSVLALPMIDV